jgi:hypothetical protein
MDEYIHTDDLLWIINSLPENPKCDFPGNAWQDRRDEIVAHLENIIESRKKISEGKVNDTFGKPAGTFVGPEAGKCDWPHVSTGLHESMAYEPSNFRTTIPMSKWKDISSEEHREYRFRDGEVVRIDRPKYLLVDKNGNHLIFDGEFSHCVPPGWVHRVWKTREGHNHFDF